MLRRGHEEYEDKDTFSPWETYSDLYCGLLLVFVLLFFFAIYQYIDARETNDADTRALQTSMQEEQEAVLALYKADLADQVAAYNEKNEALEAQKSQLSLLQDNLEQRESELEASNQTLAQQERELERQNSLLAANQEALGEQSALLAEKETELAQQTRLLQTREEQLALQDDELRDLQTQMREQQALLSSQQALLDQQALEIEQIIGVRSELISALTARLKESGLQAEVDIGTGAIAFESEILFALDSAVLKEEGKAFFEEFMPVYLSVLLQPEFAPYIAEIIIEGHTDSAGTYLHNLELSQQRAYSVAAYMIGEETVLAADQVKKLKTLVTVNGCADRSPVYNGDGTVDEEKSRRVEIKFRLKDQEMIQELDEILNAGESAKAR